MDNKSNCVLYLWDCIVPLKLEVFPIFTHIYSVYTIKKLIKSSIKVLDGNRIYLIGCMLVQDQIQEGQWKLCEFKYLYLEFGFIFKYNIWV